ERPAEWPPADLEGAEATRMILRHHLAHAIAHLHQQRAIGPNPVSVDNAAQPPDRLAGHLAQDVPERDVDAADHVSQRAATAHPEGVLVQLLADALGLARSLAATHAVPQP